jgi:hypothetical protein
MKEFLGDARSDRMVFACHTPEGRVEAPDGTRVLMWDRAEIADRAVANALYDRLIERSN